MQRNLVVCCDGTWNTPTQKDRGLVVPSNVVKMSRAIDDSDPARQRIYYDTGVGTGRGIDKWFGGAFGVGLTDNIEQAYRWIADEYRDGDRLCFFGFSRGAYTVRSLAGLIGRCGLTGPGDAKAARKAYELYRQASDDRARSRASEFKAGQRDVQVHFLGVWDTVGSLGVPALSRYGLLRKTVRVLARGSKFAHGFHDENLGRHVVHAYHAVAIDEERGPFAPSLWKADGSVRENVEQVWFAGVHCNIGGGYVDAGLSDHALLWMAAKAMKAGLALDYRYLAMRVDPNCHGELRDSKTLAYHLIPDHEREIGLPSTLNERVHQSAVSRMRHPTNGYRPRNLMRALDTGVPVTDEGLDLLERIRAALYPELPGPDVPKRVA
jgi:uncharacterized protein (DUF2235 family)